MYIESVPNRNSPPAILLRESYRDAGTVRKRTLANLSKWPTTLVEGLRILLKGGTAVADLTTAFDIIRSRPHGHVAAVLGTLRKLRLDRVIALVVARILAPGSKLATARGLAADTARDSLAEALGIESVDEDELYGAMDWLLERQGVIEQRLAKHHLSNGALVLYDLSSTYFEGRCCPLAKRGYSRDGKRGKLQIVFGLLCNREGCPVAVEVFEGNTADPRTVGAQIDKLRRRFALERVVLVGDRGMLTEARIREEVAPAGLDWITTLRAPALRALVSCGAVQRSMFDDIDLAEIRSPARPHCRGDATREAQAQRPGDDRPSRGQGHCEVQDGQALRTRHHRDRAHLAAQRRRHRRRGRPRRAVHRAHQCPRHRARCRAHRARLQGIERGRARVPQPQDRRPEGRPIYHYAASRVRAHVFLCMLAYYVEWHMRQRLKALLFDDEEPQAAQAARASVVAPAEVSPSAQDKARRKRTASGESVHSFRTLLDDLATIAKNRVVAPLANAEPFDLITRPTALQRKAFKLLGVRLERTQ